MRTPSQDGERDGRRMCMRNSRWKTPSSQAAYDAAFWPALEAATAADALERKEEAEAHAASPEGLIEALRARIGYLEETVVDLQNRVNMLDDFGMK